MEKTNFFWTAEGREGEKNLPQFVTEKEGKKKIKVLQKEKRRKLSSSCKGECK